MTAMSTVYINRVRKVVCGRDEFTNPETCIAWVALYMSLLLIGLNSAQAAAPYTWIERCDSEIGATVPAFSCDDDNIGTEVPKVMLTDKTCEKPEMLNNRCVHKSRVGRIVTADTKKNDVDIIFSCRKNMQGGLHETDTSNKYWDIAVIQYSRKNGKTCFYQHLDVTADADDKAEAPASNSPAGIKFWDFRVNFCTTCHTNGPFVRSPHYWNDVKDSNGKRYLPEEAEINNDNYTVIHPNPPVANVDIEGGNGCTTCHNIGVYFQKNKWRLGLINAIAAGMERSLAIDPDDIYEAFPSPTKTGNHDFMAGETSNPLGALLALEECLKGQTEKTIDTSILPPGCKVTQIYNPLILP